MKDEKRRVSELQGEALKVEEQIVALLDKRAKVSRAIGEIRKVQGTLPSSMESVTARDVLARSSGEIPKGALEVILREIHASCLSLELPVAVAYAGADGGWGHAAARLRFGADARCLAADTIPGALDEVTRHRAEFAVVPLETRAEGQVQATFAALTASDLKLVGAFETSFNLELLTRRGAAGSTSSASALETIYVTPQDHALCQEFLLKTAPAARIVDVKTPMNACQMALESPSAGAIATEFVGVGLGLDVAIRSVADLGDAKVRYAIVGTRPAPRAGGDVTSVAFAVRDTPGALLDVLRHFAERGVNLSMIQSRPGFGSAGGDWGYVFYVELGGHPTDRPIVTALEEVKKLTKFCKVLGSYAL